MHKTNPRSFRFAIEAVLTGTAQADPGNEVNAIHLAAAAFAANDELNQRFIVITAGVNANLPPRRIINSVVATLVATVEPAWPVEPDATSVYAIFEALTDQAFEGTATAGAAQSITLGDRESTKNDYYNGLMVDITGGAGTTAGQTVQRRQIIDYVGSSRLATVNAAWDAGPGNPAAGSRYRVQGHLYFPCRDLEVFEDASSAMRFGRTPGAIAFGDYLRAVKYGGDGSGYFDNYLEVALDVGGTIVNVNRWEA